LAKKSGRLCTSSLTTSIAMGLPKTVRCDYINNTTLKRDATPA